HHRFDHGEREAGLANGAEEESIVRDEWRELRRWDRAEATERLGAEADEIDRHGRASPVEEISAHSSAALVQIVDRGDAARNFAGVPRLDRQMNAVLDDMGA